MADTDLSFLAEEGEAVIGNVFLEAAKGMEKHLKYFGPWAVADLIAHHQEYFESFQDFVYSIF